MNIGLNGHEFEQTVGESGGQRSLACYGPWHDLATEEVKQLTECCRSFVHFTI